MEELQLVQETWLAPKVTIVLLVHLEHFHAHQENIAQALENRLSPETA